MQFNIFMMTLNSTGDAKKELDRLHSELIKNKYVLLQVVLGSKLKFPHNKFTT